jgi:FtsZ-binding cell division protein ZapB
MSSQVNYQSCGQLDTITGMRDELEQLAEKTDALVAIVEQLRQENTRLRSQLAKLTATQRDMEERLTLAARRVESILEQLPQE